MNRPAFIEHPWERRGVVSPGLPLLPHGVERHPVPGGGSRAVPIDKGDEISVMDREGLQPCEIVFFAPDGASDAAMIGAKGQGEATGLQRALSWGDTSGRRVQTALEKSGFDLGRVAFPRVRQTSVPGLLGVPVQALQHEVHVVAPHVDAPA